MKIKLNRENYLNKINKLKSNIDFMKIINSQNIYLDFIVGNKSIITIKNITSLYTLLNLDKNKMIHCSFMVDKESELNEVEFEFYFYSSENKEQYTKKLTKISLDKILK